ncbi:MAG: 16S rRNA (guanine(527)-N(7))-methyltransferase RsmG [Wenzhouxiangellaceae bacterium]|nr:16S rRNA (guanine(527)-N(7))-methyltransferase RsmG [Wenzhouxiangellaceae bacterium]
MPGHSDIESNASRAPAGSAEQWRQAGIALAAGLDALEQSLAPDRRQAMLDYLHELVRWSRAYNLTAVTEPLEMVDRHLIDSLSIRPFVQADRVLDVGTGAGLPGVPLAIAEPGRHFMLIDSNGKKVRFLRHIQRTLSLDNIEPVHARLEQLAPAPGACDVIARALAPLPRLVDWLAPWLARGGRLLAMKAQLEESERSGVPDAYNVRIEPLRWPGQRAERCLAIVTLGDSD